MPTFNLKIKFELEGVTSVVPEEDKLWHLKVCAFALQCHVLDVADSLATAKVRKLRGGHRQVLDCASWGGGGGAWWSWHCEFGAEMQDVRGCPSLAWLVWLRRSQSLHVYRCERQNNVSIVESKGAEYTSENAENDDFVTMLQLDCRGVEIEEFAPMVRRCCNQCTRAYL